MTPEVHSLTPQMDAQRCWAVGACDAQPLQKPAFALSLSAESSIMADALFRCERANARLLAYLTVPSSDPDHDYLRSWVDRV
eukprot:304178-Pleurochrysis_carterae.AAC.1